MMRLRVGPPISKGRSRGVATIEAAIALPLLAMLMLGTVEIGRAFVQYTTLATAVRQAARHAAGEALLGTTQTVFISPALNAETRNLTVFGNPVGTGSPRLPGLAVTQITVSDAGNDNVLVSAAYPYQPLFGAQLRTFVGAGPISTAFQMRIDITMRAL